MKWFRSKRDSPTDRAAAERSVADTERQKRAADEREPIVNEDSRYMRQAHQANGFTNLFLTTIREKHS